MLTQSITERSCCADLNADIIKTINMEIIAHRGASKLACENTLKAIKKAIHHKADGVEIDLRLTKDKQVVVYHDKKLNRLTKSKALVRNKTLEELKKLKVGNTEYMPTLKQALKLTPKGKKFTWHLEIKDINVIPYLAPIIKPYHKKIVFSSFKLKHLVALKKIFPHIPCAFISKTCKRKVFNQLKKHKISDIHLSINCLTPKNIAFLHKKKMRVRAWCTDDPEVLKKLMKLKIDSLMTNRPEIIKNLV